MNERWHFKENKRRQLKKLLVSKALFCGQFKEWGGSFAADSLLLITGDYRTALLRVRLWENFIF